MKTTEPINALPAIVAPPPGPASREWTRRLQAVECHNVTWVTDSFPIVWVRARGCNVWDPDGNRYVDLAAGFGAAAAGHGHPRIVEAIRAQAARLAHAMGDVHPPAAKVELIERLAALAPFPDARVMLATNGGEAIEIALKTACLFTGKPGAIAFTGAYHGLTYGALSVTDGAPFRGPFEAQLNRFVLRAGFPHPFRPPPRLGGGRELAHAAVADVAALLASEDGRQVGAVIVEPIQGRAGIVEPPAGFLSELARLCREHEVVLIVDEVLTGLGRTGAWFACERDGVVPDLVCLGKALSGSLPISACIGPARIMDAWPPSRGDALHTATFAGNPIACAAANAALTVLEEENLIERAERSGQRLLASLRAMAEKHEMVGDVRGRGLLVGIELTDPTGGATGTRAADGTRAAGSGAASSGAGAADEAAATAVLLEALRRGWLLLKTGPEGNVLSLSPALNTPDELLEEGVRVLDQVLAHVASTRADS